MSDPSSTGNTAFCRAAEEVKNLQKKPSDSDLLKIYALYKQGIEGDNTTAKPSFYDFKNVAKWNAWSELRELSKEDAQKKYIALVDSLKTAPQ
ncbi:acyl-CoA-binding protein (ACBP)/diazepam binding inhibitor (DBI)/endozepine (EP) [Mitosporidium daphniae]